MLLGVFVFGSVKNDSWFKHLTNWGWVWHIIATFLLLYEFWDTNERTIRDGVLNVGSNFSGAIIAGMIVLYVQDRSILEEAEDQYGKAVMELGNIILHFVPYVLYWGFHALHRHLPSLYTRLWKRPDASFLLFSALHYFVTVVILASYGSLFNARDEYGSKIDPITMGVALLTGAFFNHVLFVETICVKSTRQ